LFLSILKKFINKLHKNMKMKIWVHTVVSSIIALLLYPVFNWKVLLVLVGGVLIDADHYLYTIIKFKNLSIADSYNFHRDNTIQKKFKKIKDILLIFHTIEFLIIMTILSFYSDIFLIITLGIILHYLLDFIDQYSIAGHIMITPSIAYWLIKNNK